MINRISLINDLSKYGFVRFCDNSNLDAYLVYCVDWTSDLETFLTICNNYILPYYSELNTFIFENGEVKGDYRIPSPIIE